jgi:hypothetical protein
MTVFMMTLVEEIALQNAHRYEVTETVLKIILSVPKRD